MVVSCQSMQAASALSCRDANVLVKRHGQDAPIRAAMRADAMLDKCDLDGYAVWRRILRAVEKLQRVVPSSGEQVN